jgi:hypothetical protein
MAFPDPQSVTINAVPISLPRIGSSMNGGAFQSVDANTKLTVSHTYGKRARHLLRLDVLKNAADPLNPTTNLPYTMGVYVVADCPLFGYSAAEQKQVGDGFAAYLAASSGVAWTRLFGGES